MVARDLLLAELTGARFHVAHLSTSRSVAMVAFAKSRGLKVSCEVTPHHFAITDQELATYDSNYKMKPPLRCQHDADAVIEGIVNGVVDAIATDHAPACRQRQNAGIRALPVRHHRPRNRHRPFARRTGAQGPNHA